MWTDGEMEQCMAMAAAGQSYSRIGRALGKTRNAVAGKLNRLGVKKVTPAKTTHSPPRAKGPAKKRQPRAKPVQARKPVRQTGRVVPFRRKRRRGWDTPKYLKPGAKALPPLYMTTLQLATRNCRFIVQGVGAHALYCGHRTVDDGVSWCQHHYNTVHVGSGPNG